MCGGWGGSSIYKWQIYSSRIQITPGGSLMATCEATKGAISLIGLLSSWMWFWFNWWRADPVKSMLELNVEAINNRTGQSKWWLKHFWIGGNQIAGTDMQSLCDLWGVGGWGWSGYYFPLKRRSIQPNMLSVFFLFYTERRWIFLLRWLKCCCEFGNWHVNVLLLSNQFLREWSCHQLGDAGGGRKPN